ncbi:MAG TPA: ATP-dependent sacrificial sulfur transferase LarE [Candidatus Lachnoclostridium stercorigallinarum]|uniref:ATP-dependent sacrificial sulfur transferase LarE n=1 Tax=Candidatus Lachnoclostridium stercorigallinarum TaxID=2838634 RepID=A0A9D2K6Z2_9FIRM|nr:ATP-dependent sacrificial sulfur transferase LarE [Candidatus Lachnoclostridium stercorigallinarum]
MTGTTEAKKGRLLALMEEYGRQDVCLAFSGGVDSSLLLKLAADSAAAHGTTVYAVTFDSRLHPACDLENARKVAAELGGVHVVVTVDELEMEEIRSNPPDRCYLCKKQLFGKLLEFAAEKQVSVTMEGTNEDDLHVYRPGIRAVRELGVKSPLAEAGLTKAEVKALAAEYGISAASRPSTPCMATRLPYGAELNYKVLKQIEEGEALLREMIGGNVRLRLHGDVARIEADGENLEKAVALRGQLISRLKALGFVYITLDLEGFRSGSMDVHIRRA